METRNEMGCFRDTRSLTTNISITCSENKAEYNVVEGLQDPLIGRGFFNALSDSYYFNSVVL